MARVRLEGIRKSFGSLEVIKGIDLEIEDGEFCVFVGPSGCGKSTLLRMISGLEEATQGRIDIGDRDVTNLEPSERGIAMVFQNYALYPHLSVRQNIGFGLSLARRPKEEIAERVNAVARTLQLEALLDRKPKALSGASASVSPLAVPWYAIRPCFCSMNRFPTWMRRCARRCGSN